MEKKNLRLMRWILSLTFFAMASFIISSCKNDEDAFSSENMQTSNNESVQESNTDEIDNLAEISLESQEAASGGRAKGISDDRLKCDGTTVVFSNVSTDKTSGTVTITFGTNGCTDKKGNVRKGSIIVSWAGGKWYNEGSTRTISLSNYSINDLAIGGSRTLICTGVSGTLSDFSISWNVMADHTLIWPDSKTGTRKVNKTKTWEHKLTEDKYIVSNGPISLGVNAAEGTNRYGKSYTTSIRII